MKQGGMSPTFCKTEQLFRKNFCFNSYFLNFVGANVKCYVFEYTFVYHYNYFYYFILRLLFELHRQYSKILKFAIIKFCQRKMSD